MPISEKLKSNKFLYKFAINFGILLFNLFYRFFLSQKSRKIKSPYSKMFLKIFNLSTCNYLKKNANFDFQVACTITMIEKKTTTSLIQIRLHWYSHQKIRCMQNTISPWPMDHEISLLENTLAETHAHTHTMILCAA